MDPLQLDDLPPRISTVNKHFSVQSGYTFRCTLLVWYLNSLFQILNCVYRAFGVYLQHITNKFTTFLILRSRNDLGFRLLKYIVANRTDCIFATTHGKYVMMQLIQLIASIVSPFCCNVLEVLSIISFYVTVTLYVTSTLYKPFKYEAQIALFKDPVRTSQ